MYQNDYTRVNFVFALVKNIIFCSDDRNRCFVPFREELAQFVSAIFAYFAFKKIFLRTLVLFLVHFLGPFFGFSSDFRFVTLEKVEQLEFYVSISKYVRL